MRRPIRALTLLLAVILPVACGGPPGIKKSGKAVKGEISGVVMKGLVAGATVTAYQDDGGQKGKSVGSAVTGQDGTFTVDVGISEGPLLLEAVGGSFTDEATGKPVDMADHSLETVIPTHRLGTVLKKIEINPVTTLVAAYAAWRMGSPLRESLGSAYASAKEKVDAHFGGIDWAAIQARDLTASTDGTGLSLNNPDVAEGLFLAGLSQEALHISHELSASDSSVNAAGLVDALITDIQADGLFDGLGPNGAPIELYASSGGGSAAHHDVTGDTLRSDLARAMVEFLASSRNAAGLGRADADALVAQVAEDGPPAGSNPAPGQYIFASPGNGDIDPPRLSIDTPAAGDGVRGDVPVKLTATDPKSDIQELDFVSHAHLVMGKVKQTAAHTAERSGTLHAGAIADGPFVLHAYAVDSAGNRADVQETVTVDNSAPIITVKSPDPNKVSTVKGTLEIVGTVAPNPLTNTPVEDFKVVEPAGLKDQTTAVSGLDDLWDTTKAPEGNYQIRFEATDLYDVKAVKTVTVYVDNRLPSTVTGAVTIAGNPVAYPVVRAIALGKTTAAYPGGEPVGTKTGAEDGTFSLEITDENYDGPLELLVAGSDDSVMQTTYTDAATAETLEILASDQKALSLYLPSVTDPHGPNWTGVTISPWSTIADALAQYYARPQNPPLTPQAAAQRANEMIAGHFSRSSSASPPVYDLTHAVFVNSSRPLQTSLVSAYPTLADAGLEQLAADLNAGAVPRQTTVLTLTRYLAADISDGVFDGAVSGQPLAALASGYQIDSYTTRNDLSVAVNEFAVGPLNGMGIQTDALGRSNFYRDVSEDAREIYLASPIAYDQQAPDIHWDTPSGDGVNADSAAITLQAHAVDPQPSDGLHAFVVDSPASLAPHDTDPSLAGLTVSVPNTVPPNSKYDVVVTVTATDKYQHATTSSRAFTRPAPHVTVEPLLSANGATLPPGPVQGAFRIKATGTVGFATQTGLVLERPTGVPAGAVGADETPNDNLALSVLVAPAQGIPDGTYTFHASLSTIDGRSDSKPVTVTIDNSKPNLTATLEQPYASANGAIFIKRSGVDGAGHGVGTVTFSFTVSDRTAGVDHVSLVNANDGTVYATVSPGACHSSSSACVGTLSAKLPNGAYSLQLQAADAAGNTQPSATTTLTVDTVDPTFTSTGHPTLGGLQNPPLAGDGAPWLSRAGTDAAGVGYADASIDFMAQDLAPTSDGPISGLDYVQADVEESTAGGPTALPPVTMTAAGAASLKGPVVAQLGNGTYTLTVHMADRAGNTYGGNSSFKVHVDTGSPTLRSVWLANGVKATNSSGSDIWWVKASSPGATTGTPVFQYSAQDDASGIQSLSLTDPVTGSVFASATLTSDCVSAPCDGVISHPFSAGDHPLRLDAVDVAQNIPSHSATFDVRVDTAPPTFGSSTGPVGSNTSPDTVDGGFWLRRSGLDSAGNGYATATIQFSAGDTSGDPSTLGSGIPDPTLSISDGQSTTKLSSAACADHTTCSDTFATNLQDGVYTATLPLRDVAGNVAAARTWKLRVDTLDPTVTNSIAIPGPGQTYRPHPDPRDVNVYWVGASPSDSTRGTFQVAVHAIDSGSGLGRVRLYVLDANGVDQGVGNLLGTASCGRLGCDTTAALTLAPGTYSVRAEATDLAGNTASASTTYTVKVDVTPPSLMTTASDGSKFMEEHGASFLDESRVSVTSTVADPSLITAATVDYNPRSTSTPAVLRVTDALPGPIAWSKMGQRLRGATEQDAQDQNLPVFYVHPSDPTQAASPTPYTQAVTDLRIEYRSVHYNASSSTVVDVDWSQMSPSQDYSTSGDYFVVGSTDKLGSALATGGLTHVVTARVTDLAGNTAEKAFTFTMDIVPTPVIVRPDPSYAVDHNGDGYSVYEYGWKDSTGGAPNAQCLAGQACATQLLDPNLNPAGSAGTYLRVTHTVIVQPFNQTVQALVHQPSQTVAYTRAVAQQAFRMSSSAVRCTTSTSVTGGACTIEATTPPPCVSGWSDASYSQVWQDVDTSACTPTPISNWIQYKSSAQTGAAGAPDVVMLERASASNGLSGPVLVSSTTTSSGDRLFSLQRGVYDLFLRTPVPTISDFRALGTYAGSHQLYGQDTRNLLRYPSLLFPQSYGVVSVNPKLGTTTCLTNQGTCQGYNTVRDKVVTLEESLRFRGQDASGAFASLRLNVETCGDNGGSLGGTCPKTFDPLFPDSTCNNSFRRVYRVLPG